MTNTSAGSEHQHQIVSNTPDCFRAFLRHRLVGLIFNANRISTDDCTVTLVFDCDSGLTINLSKGSYWVEPPENIAKFVKDKTEELVKVQRELAEVISLAEGNI